MRKILLSLFTLLGVSNYAQVVPPPACPIFAVIDTDIDGYAQFDLETYVPYFKGLALVQGYDLSGYELVIYETQNDQQNGGNSLAFTSYNNVVPNEQVLFVGFNYSGTGEEYDVYELYENVGCILLHTISPTADEDEDSVENADEDVNGNLIIFDDDTDGDLVCDAMDENDDNDALSTMAEDYNANGTALDDDTNANDIPDYREASVTLGLEGISGNDIRIYPNPASAKVRIDLGTLASAGIAVSLYDVKGQRVADFEDVSRPLDISMLPSGLYVAKIAYRNQLLVKKILVY